MTISEVRDKKDKKQFIDFPHDLYQGDPNYVPELYVAQAEVMNEKKNPFFQHSKATLFLARKNGKVVGRIAAIRNNNYNDYIKANVGFFGFFDVINDYEVAKSLLDTASSWVKKENLDAILGPTNFSTNDTAGLLVNGFDSPPVINMTYNKPYYVDFLERYGFGKKMDLFAYNITDDAVSERSIQVAQKLEERLNKRGITFRNVNLKKFNEEIAGILPVYEEAWDKNWGFVPPTKEEFKHLAEGLKLVVDPKFGIVAEHEGETIGFILGIPDINEILLKIKRGRLLPFGIFKLLLGKSKVKKIRIILLGVMNDYRRMGIEGIFYAKVISRCKANGISSAEASWVLENNEMMNKGLEKINGEIYKTYRIYELPLN